MAAAFVAAGDPEDRGRLVFTATTEEETGGSGGRDGLQYVLPELGQVAAGVVGEPTRLNICNAQRGLARIILHAEGRAGHASRPWEGVNAIEIAAEDVAALRRLSEQIAETGADPLLGKPTLIATLIHGGTAPNVIPDRCDVTLDGRTTRRCDNDRLIEAVSSVVKSRVEVRSKRFQPVATDPSERIVEVARRVLPEAKVEPFGGVSDLYFLAASSAGPVPAILIGPGDGRQSHQPDEFVSVAMVRRAAAAYVAIADMYWRP
jgi:acetylornithine deacetylase